MGLRESPSKEQQLINDAIANKNIELIKELCSKHNDLGKYALYAATKIDYLEPIKFLDTICSTEEYTTALDYAADHSSINVFKYFIDKKVPITGNTLIYAMQTAELYSDNNDLETTNKYKSSIEIINYILEHRSKSIALFYVDRSGIGISNKLKKDLDLCSSI